MDVAQREPACPKRMVYGPCGGVRHDGSCEIGGRPCPFVDASLPRWPGPDRTATSSSFVQTMVDRPVVVTDLSVTPFDPRSVEAVAQTLASTCDAVLIGEHQGRPDLPPTVLAGLARAAGAEPWVTLTCRDRNAVVLESELRALAALDVAGVHCVTGDARGPSADADATQVFDLDALRLTALAVDAGLAPSVAATPAAPPAAHRPRRILDKQRAGAAFAFVNHAGGVDAVARFVRSSREIGVTLPFVVCVAVFTDARSAAALDAFPGLELDQQAVRAVLSASDPVAAGIAYAIEQAEAMLAIDGVHGVNLSGSASAGPPEAAAEIMAQVGAALFERTR